MTELIISIGEALEELDVKYILNLLRINYSNEDLEQDKLDLFLRGLTYNILVSLYNAVVEFNEILENSTLDELRKINEEKVLGLPENIFDSEDNFRIALYHMDDKIVDFLI